MSSKAYDVVYYPGVDVAVADADEDPSPFLEENQGARRN